MDQKGGVVAAIPLELTHEENSCFLVAWLGEDTWVVVARNAGGNVARRLAVDIKTRQVRAFVTLDGAYLSSLRSSGGRGLLVPHGLPDVLRHLDRRGEQVAVLREDFNYERAEHLPRYGNGQPTGRLHDLRYGPDGALWASDGEALLELNEDGVVDAVVGQRLEEGRLTEVAAATRDAGGRFYLLDRRTASVHVFDSDGTFSRRSTALRP